MKRDRSRTNRRVYQTVAAVLAIVLIAIPAAASKKTAAKTYFLLGAGQATSDFKDPALFTGAIDDGDFTWSIGAGFPIVPWLGAEVEYTDMGTTGFDGTFIFMDKPYPDEGEIETSGFAAALVGMWAVSDRVTLLGRVGLFAFDVEENELFAGVPERHTASGTSPLAGLGVQFETNGRIAVRLEARRYFDVGEANETGEGDVDSYTAGIVIRLKKKK